MTLPDRGMTAAERLIGHNLGEARMRRLEAGTEFVARADPDLEHHCEHGVYIGSNALFADNCEFCLADIKAEEEGSRLANSMIEADQEWREREAVESAPGAWMDTTFPNEY